MKTILAVCILLVACNDEQNLGNTTHDVFGRTRWALTIGGVDADAATTVALDSTGDAIVSGSFQGTVDFGNETLSAPQGTIFVSKRAGLDGSERWTLSFGDGAGSVIDAVVAPDDSIVVMGAYVGGIALGQQALQSPDLTDGSDCILAKFDPTGHLVWLHGLSAANLCSATAIAVGNDGRIAIVGGYQGTITFPNATFTAAELDPFMAMFDANGDPLWASIGTSGLSFRSVALTDEDDLVVSGDISDYTVYQDTLYVAHSYYMQLVTRWTVDGHMLWAGPLGGNGVSQQAGPIAVASNGAEIIAATSRLDNDPEAANGKPVVSELDPTGRSIWTAPAVSGSAYDNALARLADGTIVIGGSTSGYPIDLGNGTLRGCMVLAAYSAAGSPRDSIAYGDNSTGCGTALPNQLASGPGSLALAGELATPADFGTGELRVAGSTDALVVMFDIGGAP